MKINKPTTYVLIVLSIGIWGTVAYRIYDALKDNGTTAYPPVVKAAKKTGKDTTMLLLNYRDPFLGDYQPRKSEEKRQQREVVSGGESTVAPMIEVSPDFLYKGVVRSGKNVWAIVNRNGESILMKPKETIGEFAVAEVTDDKLVVIRKGKRYELPRQ
ncbi:hypothetical protein [Bacteroides sp. UBA939]|uniref:hypothetical protein n=1 Tax=Bacteroides sp. UBA939 TaxID=1946092 RepID=UPI0025BD9088|nr:hypothetical protein [Bacteroides sp. UBA939]